MATFKGKDVTTGIDANGNPYVSVVEGLENVKLPSPQLAEYYRQKENRVLSLYDEISEDTVFPVIEDILFINELDKDIPVEQRKEILLRLSSNGGDPDAAMSLVAVIQLSKTPIVIVNMCDCYSAAFLILLASKVRYSLPFGKAMWHPGSANVSGGLVQVTDTVDFLKKYEKIYEDYIISNTGIDKKIYTKIKKNDFFMTTQECLDFGIIHGVIEDIDKLYH